MTNTELIASIRKNLIPGSDADRLLDELEENVEELEEEVEYFRRGGDVG